MCIYVSIYAIVKIEIYSYNKEVNTMYTVVMFTYYILPKCAKTREPKDEHCVLGAPIQATINMTLYP